MSLSLPSVTSQRSVAETEEAIPGDQPVPTWPQHPYQTQQPSGTTKVRAGPQLVSAPRSSVQSQQLERGWPHQPLLGLRSPRPTWGFPEPNQHRLRAWPETPTRGLTAHWEGAAGSPLCFLLCTSQTPWNAQERGEHGWESGVRWCSWQIQTRLGRWGPTCFLRPGHPQPQLQEWGFWLLQAKASGSPLDSGQEGVN